MDVVGASQLNVLNTVQTVLSTHRIRFRSNRLMAKVDKSQYTKEEWLAIKAERREAKASKHVSKLPQDYYVLCLKHGTKYSSDYVNKLYNMIKRKYTNTRLT
jgi:DNA repair photolyase